MAEDSELQLLMFTDGNIKYITAQSQYIYKVINKPVNLSSKGVVLSNVS